MTTDRPWKKMSTLIFALFGYLVQFGFKWCSWTWMSGQIKGISYYRYTAERKFKISQRSNFASPSHNRWFRQKNVLNKLYTVWCDRKGDWWQWSSHWAPWDILGSKKYTLCIGKNELSAVSLLDQFLVRSVIQNCPDL